MSLFSLDILEPALTKRPSTPPRIPLQNLSSTSTVLPSTPSKPQPKQTEEPGPPRWNTPEFYFYALTFIVVVPQMVYCAWDVSRGPLSPREESKCSGQALLCKVCFFIIRWMDFWTQSCMVPV